MESLSFSKNKIRSFKFFLNSILLGIIDVVVDIVTINVDAARIKRFSILLVSKNRSLSNDKAWK